MHCLAAASKIYDTIASLAAEALWAIVGGGERQQLLLIVVGKESPSSPFHVIIFSWLLCWGDRRSERDDNFIVPVDGLVALPPPYCVVVYFWRWFSRRSHRIVIVVRTCAPPPLPEVQFDCCVRNSPPQLNAPVRRCPRRSWLCLRRRCRVSMARPLREAGLMGAMPREAGSLGGREGGE